MEAYILNWTKNIVAQAKVNAQPEQEPEVAVDTLLTPLVQRLKKFVDSLPVELRTQPQSLEFFREGLRGRQAGRKAHAGELGAALRKLGYIRSRAWSKTEGGFRALWYPPT